MLTDREAELLYLLLENKNKLVERPLVLKRIWENEVFFNGKSRDTFITKLRTKLSLDPNIKIINARGQGFKLIDIWPIVRNAFRDRHPSLSFPVL